NYTWSKSLGDEEGNEAGLRTSFRTLRDRNLDKKLLSFNRTHAVRANGVWELPFGPDKQFGRDTRGIAGKLLGGWQVGWIATTYSGQAITLTGVNAYNFIASVNANPGTPVAVGGFSKGTGGVQKTGSGVTFFDGLRQVPDPSIATIASPVVRSVSTLQAIADAS